MKKYSIDDLNYELHKEYGKNGNELQKDTNFNIWEAYSFLKGYCGMLSGGLLEKSDFDYRIKNIQDVLNV